MTLSLATQQKIIENKNYQHKATNGVVCFGTSHTQCQLNFKWCTHSNEYNFNLIFFKWQKLSNGFFNDEENAYFYPKMNFNENTRNCEAKMWWFFFFYKKRSKLWNFSCFVKYSHLSCQCHDVIFCEHLS